MFLENIKLCNDKIVCADVIFQDSSMVYLQQSLADY